MLSIFAYTAKLKLMEIFIITFAAFTLTVIGLGIGWLVKGKELQGSCGGLNKLNGMEECQICGRNPESCEMEEDFALKEPSSSRPAL